MAKMTYNEKIILSDMFNQSGYVLDFSTPKFDKFTFDSIGDALCSKYNLSKGKSLEKFFDEGSERLVGKLILDLCEYYKARFFNKNARYTLGNIDEETKQKNYETAIIIGRKYYSGERSIVIDTKSQGIIDAFNSNYISSQVKIMNENISTNPTEAIGKAKELCESCCKTVLEKSGVTVDKNWDVPRLTKEVCKILQLTPSDIDDSQRASETIKGILGNFSAITKGVAELRNLYGSGHGKDADYKGLSGRHAGLAVGAAVTFVHFIWETYLEREDNSK